MEKEVLFWTFIGIFSITAIITLLGITGVLKDIKERYLNVLFTSLILEVVAAVLILFKGTDFTSESQYNFSSLLQEAGVSEEANNKDPKAYIIQKLGESKHFDQGKKGLDSLTLLLNEAQQQLSECEGEIGQLNRSFYTKIARLKTLINHYDGFININYAEQDKIEVFTLLASIFESLQKVQSRASLYTPDNEVINQKVKSLYNNFKRSYIALEEDKQNEYYFIFQSDILQMLQAYLSIIKE